MRGPEITNLSLHSFDSAEPIKAIYNKIEAFGKISEENMSIFKNRLIENISVYDSYDNKAEKDWNSNKLESLTKVILDDFLLIDLSKDCKKGENDFFKIEIALLTGKTTDSCGGRDFNDDIMSTLYALYIAGYNGVLAGYETGVSASYQSSSKKISKDFPYLAEPESAGTFTSNIKRWLLNTLFKQSQD